MTHSAHLFVGAELQDSARHLAEYIARHGEPSVAPYFYPVTVDDKADTAENTRFFSRLYTEKVTINNPGTGLLALTVYCRLYDEKSVSRVIDIVDAVRGCGKKYHVEIIGVAGDLARIFDTSGPVDDCGVLRSRTADGLRRLVPLRENKSVDILRVVQNVNDEGLAVNFDFDSWIRLIGEYGLLRIEKYEETVPSMSRIDTSRPVDAMGLAVMNFDKDYFVDYLHSRAFVEILANERVDCREVSVNVANVVSQEVLVKLKERISEFYRLHVAPLLTRDYNRNSVIAKVTPELDSLFDEMERDLTGFISDDGLSLPEKEAVLAMILGTDNPLFKDAAISDTQMSIDDLWIESIGMFVEEGNKNGNFSEYVHNPLEAIKRLRTKIRNSTQFLRRKTEEREQKRALLKQLPQVQKRLTENGFTFEGTVYRLDSITQDETPLQHTYEPHPVKERSIDLRAGFTDIKDQGAQGSCGAFALTSMVEYVIRRSLPLASNPDLSEAFVYYNARDYEGKTSEDVGSSFYQSIRGMMERGVCDEAKHPYRAEDFTTPPSAEAVADAAKRKVTEAKNVNCCIGDIKSAIADGYPVAVSARIFDSFAGGNAGFVGFPSEAELSDKESYHAMVVAGFSDEERVFVVRNSWGERFGDFGYCYIPYDYAEKYFRNAVIITCIKVDGVDASGRVIETDVVHFNTTDNRIQEALLGIIIEGESKELHKMQDEYAKLRMEYEILVNRFSNPNGRKAISDSSKCRLQGEIADLKKEEERRYSEGNKKIADYRVWSLKTALWLSIVAVVLFSVWGYLLYHGYLEKWTFIGGAVSGALATGLWIYRTLWMKILKRKRNESVAEVAERRGVKETELRDIDLRLHVQGMVIDRLSMVSNYLKNVYDRLSAYVGNLRVWYEEECGKLGTMEPVKRDPFISIIDNNVLDRYFTENCTSLIEGMHLYEEFSYFELSDEGLQEVKSHLKERVDKILSTGARKFMMYHYLSGTENYAFLPAPPVSQELLPFLMRKSAVFVEPENIDTISNKSGEHRLFMHFPTPDECLRWSSDNNRYFYDKPVVETILSPDKVVVLTTRRFTPEEIFR